MKKISKGKSFRPIKIKYTDEQILQFIINYQMKKNNPNQMIIAPKKGELIYILESYMPNYSDFTQLDFYRQSLEDKIEIKKYGYLLREKEEFTIRLIEAFDAWLNGRVVDEYFLKCFRTLLFHFRNQLDVSFYSFGRWINDIFQEVSGKGKENLSQWEMQFLDCCMVCIDDSKELSTKNVMNFFELASSYRNRWEKYNYSNDMLGMILMAQNLKKTYELEMDRGRKKVNEKNICE